MSRPIRAFVLVALLTTAWSRAAVAELSMSLDRNPVRVNETFTLDVKSDDADADEPRLDLPDGVQMIRRNTISSRSIINGRIEASRTWRYNLVARQPGEFVFPALRIGQDKADPISVTVLAADSKAAATGNQPLLLKASVDQKSVLPQQQIILTVQLLRNVPVRFAQMSDPKPANALVQKLGEDSEYETTVNGVSYMVIERRYALFPQQAGELVIDPIRFQGDVSAERQLSLFGAFNETQPVSLQTQQITIDVRTPTAADAGLPAQQVELTDTISDGPYRAGEPLTWTVTVTADGVLPAQLPELLPGTGTGTDKSWRVYPDQPQDNVQVIASGVRTVRTQKFALVPTQPGSQDTPTLTLPWWRLSDGSAQQATLPAHHISVAANANGNSSSATVNATAARTKPVPPSVATPAVNQPEPVASAAIVSDNTARWWPWLTALFALLWLLTAALWWFSRRRNSSVAAAAPSTPPQHDASTAKALVDACKRHDAHAARDHLLQLTGSSSLSALAELHEGAAAAAIHALNHALYGPPPQRWQGDSLATLVPQLLRPSSKTRKNTAAALPPLYPAA
ncbi:protein BatD [Permianibacter sp. IMCC34836]|uniref:BatD family protein n=1 Tax=Permianibacter fluminis TaxID=2738515 RepID=UPI001551F6BA|nr:BatD family protein [Permianibacter fluminis]NQD38659.1 protein BatD [Permianibacter fluminis]